MSNGRKTRSRKNCTQERAIDDVLAALCLIEFKTVIQEKTTPRSQSVALGISIARRSGFVVMVGTCGSTECTDIKRRVPKVFYCERCALTQIHTLLIIPSVNVSVVCCNRT